MAYVDLIITKIIQKKSENVEPSVIIINLLFFEKLVAELNGLVTYPSPLQFSPNEACSIRFQGIKVVRSIDVLDVEVY